MPLICCSSGAATVSAISSAVAPGYTAFTETVGGAMFGYWSTGSVQPRDQADQRDDHRHRGREDRPVDEEMREPHGRLVRAARALGSPAGAEAAASRLLFSPRETPAGNAVTVPSVTATLRPGRARCTPLMMTRSCGARPARITRRPSIRRPGVDHLLRHDAPASTV